MSDIETVDVAIVGGGASGVYTGWRLVGEGAAGSPRRSVVLYEGSDRIGGRLETVVPPGMPSLRAELGGMRFLNTQQYVASLVRKLGLTTEPFPVDEPENLNYLRGERFRNQEATDPAKVPYHVSWLERGKTAGTLIADAIEAVVPGATQLTAAQWARIKREYRWNGQHLYDLGFWNVLLRVMSSEAFQLVRDDGGYTASLTNWNTAEAMPWYLADFNPSSSYLRVTEGYQLLPLTLAKQFEEGGGSIELGRRLEGFEPVEGGGGKRLLRLRFADGPAVDAHHLVLAMPRRSLELLDQSTEFFRSPVVRDLIATVSSHPMLKIFLCYRYPWWTQAGLSQGKSDTDLPLRQIYYVGTEPGGAEGDPALGNSLLLASYDDDLYVSFWEGFERVRRPEVAYAASLADGERDSVWERLAAPEAMVEEAQRQLRLVHDLPDIPRP